MCGIFGKINLKHSLVEEEAALTAALQTLKHRGPDGGAHWIDQSGRIYFGHRRLSIIDLSASANQPMHDTNGNVTVFNGEIYNYKELKEELQAKGHVFKTASDTEVLLKAYSEYGNDFLSHLNGMFSLAIYDLEKQKIIFARDRAGEKPFFYKYEEKSFVFASELKAILSDTGVNNKINAEALDCFLGFGFVPGDRCIIKGIKKLPPAHLLELDLSSGKTIVSQYWKLPDYNVSTSNENELQFEFEQLLQDAVSKQLVADVPVGVLLSGGIDSSLITAMAVRARSDIKTFNIRFPGHKQFDETEHARLIARHFNTHHVELEASAVSVEILPLLAKQYDEPIIDSSMIPTYMVSKLIRQYCTVALGGDGGDELFGGSGHYNRLLWLQQKAGWIPHVIMAPIASTIAGCMPFGMKGRNWIQGFGQDLNKGLPRIASYFDKNFRDQLVIANSFSHPAIRAEKIRSERVPNNPDLLQRATRMDFQNYLPEDILVKVDRASMLSSLEVRAPFLDYRLIEFAFGKVPTSLKATATNKKILLKKICGKILPPEFDRQRKQGFSIPLATWLQKGPWLDFFKEVLLDSPDTIFDKKAVTQLFEGQQKGYANNEKLFSLVLFELWRKQYHLSL